MEKDLNELLLQLFPLISPMTTISSGTSDDYFSELSKNYEHLPPMTQNQVTKQYESFKCSSCTQYIASKEFSCGHKQCSSCFNPSSFGISCPCKLGRLKKSPDHDQKLLKGKVCFNCSKVFNNLDLNCSHFCEKCVKHFSSLNINKCCVCSSPLVVYEDIGGCTKCFANDVKVVYACNNHAHCSNCASFDLLHMACHECGLSIEFTRLSRILSFVKPQCNNCGNRLKSDVVWNMTCCGKSFCYFCLGGNQNCFCGQKNDYFEFFRGYDQYARQFLNDFRKIEYLVK